MENLIKEIEKIRPLKKDGVIKIIPVNKKMSFNVISPIYSPKLRKIKHFYDDCYVVSINGKIVATLRSKKNPCANCVIYDNSKQYQQNYEK